MPGFDVQSFTSGLVGVVVGALSSLALFGARLAVHERRFLEIERTRTEDLSGARAQRLEDGARLDARLADIRASSERAVDAIGEHRRESERRERYMLEVLADLAAAAGVKIKSRGAAAAESGARD